MEYKRDTVDRIARIVSELTGTTFECADSGNSRTFHDSGGELTWTGRSAAQQAAAFYAGAGVRWAEMSDTVAKVHDLILQVATEARTSSPSVRAAYQGGRDCATARHADHQRRCASAYVGEARKLLAHNRAEFIAWCGGRTHDDPTSDSVYAYTGDGEVLVRVGDVLSCIDRGWYRVYEP